jgi:hypothetical protein
MDPVLLQAMIRAQRLFSQPGWLLTVASCCLALASALGQEAEVGQPDDYPRFCCPRWPDDLPGPESVPAGQEPHWHLGVPLGFPREAGDNRLLELRRPGNPEGVGSRSPSKHPQALDSGATEVVVGFQAMRPSGLKFNGLGENRTPFIPAVGLCRQLGEGTAVQGFVGKDVRGTASWTNFLDGNLQYGMAVQAALPGGGRGPGAGVYVFVEALGRHRPEGELQGIPPAAWEVLPGVHWKSSDSWSISGGVLVPLGTSRPETGLFQLTGSWQF